MKYIIRDPFAGDVEVHGDTIEDAVADAYSDVPHDERPAYVWHEGEQIELDGPCRPVQ